MSEILALFSIIYFTAIGFLLIRFFQLLPSKTYLELPLSFGLGCGISAFQLYIYSRLGLPWLPLFLFFPWIVLLLFYLYKNLNNLSVSFPSYMKIDALPWIYKAILLLTVVLILFVGFEAILRPVTSWDGWTDWILKAKIFYIDKSVNKFSLAYLQSDYPILISLVATYVYLFLGQLNDRVVLILFWAYYAMTGVIVFASLWKKIEFKHVVVVTFLLLSIQNLIRHGGRYEAGDADLILGFYIFSTSILLTMYHKIKKINLLILLELFLVFTSLIKNEGLFFAIVVQIIVVLTILRGKNIKSIFFFLIWLIPVLEWQIFKQIIHLPTLPSYISLIPHPERVILILIETSKEFFNIFRWNLLWISFLLCFIYYKTQKKENSVTLLYFLFFMQLANYLGVYFFTNVDLITHIHNTFDRLLLHIAPLAAYVIAVTIYPNTQKRVK